jgi:carboxylesterase type B
MELLRTRTCSSRPTPRTVSDSQECSLLQADNIPVVEFFGTPHFTEIGYVFYNRIGLGYAKGQSPLTGASKEVLQLAKLVTRMWISFINDLDPNSHGSKIASPNLPVETI